jgi:hypothetical protein
MFVHDVLFKSNLTKPYDLDVHVFTLIKWLIRLNNGQPFDALYEYFVCVILCHGSVFTLFYDSTEDYNGIASKYEAVIIYQI